MDSDSASKSIENNENYSQKKKEAMDEMKPILKKQIAGLKSIISQMESNLGIVKFSQVKCDFPLDTLKVTETQVQDINILLEHQLRELSGFSCAKFTRDEHVFHLSCSNKSSKKDMYAVQIINTKGKWSLGKWTMPMGIDLDYLVSQNPINEVKNIPRFLKLCKLHLDAYCMRHEQYIALKDIVSRTKNCKLQSSLGYRHIILELRGIYNQETDNFMNISVYLFYNSDNLLPHKIEIESSLNSKLDEKIAKRFKKSLRCFQEFMLQVAFDKMSIMEPFVWTKEEDIDSPLACDMLSSLEEEGLLAHFSVKQKKSSISRKKKNEINRDKSKREVSNVSNENRPVTSQNEQEESQNEKIHSENAKPVVVVNPTVSNLKGIKFKQIKIQFPTKSKSPKTKNNSSNENNTSSLNVVVAKNKKIDEQSKLCTSTPLRSNRLRHDRSANIDISDITLSEINSNAVKRSELKEQAQNNAPEELVQSKNNTKKRKINSRAVSKSKGLKRKKKV
ncbi:uncharacterized protein LOC108624185 [Ceratina calcarata]|uniref:Uncharacterized protein LOC108624185 n=1 Tax=Ceratina calcarata TaxID=156304 RepID=A0AAJ7IWB8_9HYME|nr:uncharacterized protein LOC108624185 [Ceratina calcarata]